MEPYKYTFDCQAFPLDDTLTIEELTSDLIDDKEKDPVVTLSMASEYRKDDVCVFLNKQQLKQIVELFNLMINT